MSILFGCISNELLNPRLWLIGYQTYVLIGCKNPGFSLGDTFVDLFLGRRGKKLPKRKLCLHSSLSPQDKMEQRVTADPQLTTKVSQFTVRHNDVHLFLFIYRCEYHMLFTNPDLQVCHLCFHVPNLIYVGGIFKYSYVMLELQSLHQVDPLTMGPFHQSLGVQPSPDDDQWCTGISREIPVVR